MCLRNLVFFPGMGYFMTNCDGVGRLFAKVPLQMLQPFNFHLVHVRHVLGYIFQSWVIGDILRMPFVVQLALELGDQILQGSLIIVEIGAVEIRRNLIATCVYRAFCLFVEPNVGGKDQLAVRADSTGSRAEVEFLGGCLANHGVANGSLGRGNV